MDNTASGNWKKWNQVSIGLVVLLIIVTLFTNGFVSMLSVFSAFIILIFRLFLQIKHNKKNSG